MFAEIENRVSNFEGEAHPGNGTFITIITIKQIDKNRYSKRYP